MFWSLTLAVGKHSWCKTRFSCRSNSVNPQVTVAAPPHLFHALKILCFPRMLAMLQALLGCSPWGILSAIPAPWCTVPSLNRSKTYPGLCTDSQQAATRQGWSPALPAGWGWTGAQSTRCRETREGSARIEEGDPLASEKHLLPFARGDSHINSTPECL